MTDNLAIRQVVDPAAIALASDFINGSLVINSQPTLSITHDIQNVMLSWPLWATNFTLQEATSGSVSSLNWTNVSATIGVINNEAAVTLPVTGTTKLYRLQKH